MRIHALGPASVTLSSFWRFAGGGFFGGFDDDLYIGVGFEPGFIAIFIGHFVGDPHFLIKRICFVDVDLSLLLTIPMERRDNFAHSRTHSLALFLGTHVRASWRFPVQAGGFS